MSLARIILQLHSHRYGDRCSPEAARILFILQHGLPHGPLTRVEDIARELLEERIISGEARAVVKSVYRRLRNYDVVIRLLHCVGYDAILLRPLLTTHFTHLLQAAIGSDGHCVRMDIAQALPRCSDLTRQVIGLLVTGTGVRDIGEALHGHGPRMVKSALRELARRLEGENDA